jgi:hypothetical protein
MKFVLAMLAVCAASPAFAGPALNCTSNGKSLTGVLHEDNRASVTSTEGAYEVTATAVRSGGYKGSPVTDEVTINVTHSTSGQGIVEVTALSAARLAVNLPNGTISMTCSVSNF